MERYVEELLAYLRRSPSCYHAVQASAEALAGFERLYEQDAWSLVPGGRYLVTRDQSSLIAFTLPEGPADGFRIAAAHTDSPTFKVKENAELAVQGKYTRLDVERYGGMIMSTWLDRPLSLAGRVMVRTKDGVEARLIAPDRDLVLIPSVAIHMNRTVNDGYKFDASKDTMPLWGSGATKDTFRAVIAREAGVSEADLMGTDLYLCSRTPAAVWGAREEYLSAGRLDDLECAFSAVTAIREAGATEGKVNVCCVLNNEEVGSLSKQGADSTFLRDVLERVRDALGLAAVPMARLLANSFMLSADNAHATHPNHPEYADPVNQVWMNEGVVIKSNASQKYTTDAVSRSIFTRVCEHAGVPVQSFANRSDMAGGSTLGNISNSHVSVNMVDIGLAQLAMHSSYETAGVKDLAYMIDAMRTFYQTDLHQRRDGGWQLRFMD